MYLEFSFLKNKYWAAFAFFVHLVHEIINILAVKALSYSTKLCINQVPSWSLSRWRTLTLEKIKIGWVLWCIKLQTMLRRVLWINAQLTIVWSLKHHSTQPTYIFNRENPQNSESPKGPRRGLDFIALVFLKSQHVDFNGGAGLVSLVNLKAFGTKYDQVDP